MADKRGFFFTQFHTMFWPCPFNKSYKIEGVHMHVLAS